MESPPFSRKNTPVSEAFKPGQKRVKNICPLPFEGPKGKVILKKWRHSLPSYRAHGKDCEFNKNLISTIFVK